MRKAIAIDFDGCLCTNAYPEIGEPNWHVIYRAKAEQQVGAGLILWTCREGQLLLNAIAACEGWGLTFDAVNESLPDWIETFGTKPRKIGASEYWDDKAVRQPDVISTDVSLTLEELREMDGEFVWCEMTAKGWPSFYGIVHGNMVTGYKKGYPRPINLEAGERGGYGLAWIAYRRKPEEVIS